MPAASVRTHCCVSRAFSETNCVFRSLPRRQLAVFTAVCDRDRCLLKAVAALARDRLSARAGWLAASRPAVSFPTGTAVTRRLWACGARHAVASLWASCAWGASGRWRLGRGRRFQVRLPSKPLPVLLERRLRLLAARFTRNFRDRTFDAPYSRSALGTGGLPKGPWGRAPLWAH